MIFHTSADKTYYEYFYEMYYTQVKKFYPNPVCSFNYVGTDKQVSDFANIDIITLDLLSENDFSNKFPFANIKGYYALSRWLSIPVKNEDVLVSDIDVLTINEIDKTLVDSLLQQHQVINITRMKPNGQEGGMMVMILRKDICEEVRKFANSLLSTETIGWATDVLVGDFLYKNYNVKNLLKMHSVQKNQNLEGITDWFIFCKSSKFHHLQNIYKNII